MTPPTPLAARGRTAGGLALGVALFAAALFGAVLANGWALDDGPLIRDNPLLRNLANLPRFFTSDYWEPRLRAGLYRPLVTMSYALNHALGGLDPRGYHALDVALHAGNSALALLLVRRWTGSLWLAAATAFLFAAHAVHAEPLANVASGRPELLAACFFLLSLWTAGRPGEGRAAPASVLCFGLALLCKESAITLIGVLLLLDAVYGDDASPTWARAATVWRRRAGVYAPYGLVAVAYLGLRWLVLPGAEVLPAQRDLDNPLLLLPWGWRVVNALQVALRYAGLLLLPLRLSYDYSYAQIPLIRSFAEPGLYLVLAAWGAGAWAWLASARRSREVFFAVGFALITFSVASNLLVPIGTIMAERLLYLPSLGFCLAASAGLAALARRLAPHPGRRKAVFAGLAALLVAAHSGRALDRSLDWRTENGLYLHDLGVSPGSAKVQSNAGAAYAEQGQHEEALRCYERAIEIAPDFAAPRRGRVLALLALGRYGEAQAAYPETLRFGPPVPAVEEAIQQGLRRRHPQGDPPATPH
jgi:tetratricopeptide (TPR) repeat protein